MDRTPPHDTHDTHDVVPICIGQHKDLRLFAHQLPGAGLACQWRYIHTFDMRYALGTSVGERGQITIERGIREQLGIKPKDLAVQRVQDGRLVVEFVRPPEPHMRSLAGILGPSPGQPREPLDIDSAVAQSVAEEWRRSLAREVATDGVVASRPRTRRSR